MNNLWNIQPFIGFGALRFGEDRARVRSQLGPEFTSFRKSPLSETDTDAYIQLHLHLYYDRDDRLDLIEAVSRHCGQISIGSVSIFDNSLDGLIAEMRKAGHVETRGNDGCYFETVGISVYSTDATSIAAVSVFAQKRFSSNIELRRRIAQKRLLRKNNGQISPPLFGDTDG